MIVGDGAERERLERITMERGLENVLWEEPQPRHRIADFYNASDACLVHMRKADLFTRNVPSKMYEIMATGRPMLLGTNGESRELGERAGCAVTFSPENAEELAHAVGTLISTPEKSAQLGESGRQYVKDRYDWQLLAQRYLKVLVSAIDTTSMQSAG
jgi:glycosyltransferase involved in cell wall biosynthesis